MLQNVKKWFSVENNVCLVRDLLFIGALLFALIAGLTSCTPLAYAAEPTVVKLNFDDYPSLEIPSTYTDYLIMYKDGTLVKLYVVDIRGDITTERVAEINGLCCIPTPGGYSYQLYRLTDGVWTKDFETSNSSTSLNFVGTKVANVVYSLWDISLNNYTNEPSFNANFSFPENDYWSSITSSSKTAVSLIITGASQYVLFLMSNLICLLPVALVIVLYIFNKTRDSVRGG